MHQPLDEWDEAYVVSIAGDPTSGTLEKKGCDLFDPATPASKKTLREELAKEVCAFSNAGGGYLVYGMEKTGTLDGGVAELCAGEPLKAWVEAEIPKLQISPPVTNCQAKFISSAGHHAPGRGVLVVFIPSSVRRPHWLPPATAYIRAGEHSVPMNLQTFLDISSREDAPQAIIETLGYEAGPHHGDQGTTWYLINPRIKLVSGPLSRDWAFELHVPERAGYFLVPDGSTMKLAKQSLTTLGTGEPLFPGRSTAIGSQAIRLYLKPGLLEGLFFTASLYVAAAQPVVREFTISEFRSRPKNS